MAVAKVSAFELACVNLQSTDFELFQLAEQFAQDRGQLDARWKDLQREAHPDKFTSHGAAAQRVAMQWSVRINEAYQRLRDPVKRAAYICELHNAPINAENNTAMPSAFLMQQIELREELDDAKTTQNLDQISLQSNKYRHKQLSEIEQLLDQKKDYLSAAQAVRALMFIERFAQDIETRYEVLGQ